MNQNDDEDSSQLNNFNERDDIKFENISQDEDVNMNSHDKIIGDNINLNIIEEDEEVEKRQTFKQNLDIFLSDGNRKYYIETISAFNSFITFIIYIASTYFDEESFLWFNYSDYVVCFMYNLETLMNIYLAQHRWYYFIKDDTLIDIFTSTLPYAFSIENIFIKKLIELARIFRIIRVTRYMTKNMKNNENEVAKHITIMILSTFTLILIFTLVFRLAEIDMINYYIMNPEINRLDLINQSRFHDFLYFIVVTLSTVGYGDIYPLTEQGRVVIVLLILIALVLIPKQTNELIKLMSISSVYSRAMYISNPEVPHILICGHVSVESLKNFCQELFHVDHGTQDKNAVIIQNSSPGQEMKVFLHAGTYETSLKFLQGNPLIEKDLMRSDILNSKACVIMTNKYTDDPHMIDHHNILLSLSIKKYFLYHNKNSQLFIQLIKPENKIHYQSGLQSLSHSNFNSDQVIIIEEIKMNLLSKSCLIPGIITLTSNLVMSAGSQSEDLNSLWVEEYTEGRGHEIYRTLLNDCFKNKTFSKLSSEIYEEYEAIVFALEIEIEGKTIIRLNPGTFNVEKLLNERDDVKIYIYIICSDKAVADRIETAEGRIEKIEESAADSILLTNKKPSRYDIYMKLNIEDTQQIDENVDPGNEMGEEEDEYFIIKDNVNNNVDVKKDSIRNSEEIKNHIIVCGTHPSLYYFILPLRAKYLGRENLKWVVILTLDMPKDLWDSISRFENIILINGSPLNIEDLYRANIEYADKAVILECENSRYDNYNSEIVDSESVFIYKAIKKCNQNIQIMTELVYDSNIEFLLPKQELEDLNKSGTTIRYETTSLFAAGEVYIGSIIDTLTCQAYYNPHIVTIIHQLLTGGKNTSNYTMRGICENVDLKSSNLWQMPIPERFINRTFRELYTELAETENIIALGLYRFPGVKDNDHPYVYTNPKPSTRLTHRDKIFVLAVDNINCCVSGWNKNSHQNLNFNETNDNLNNGNNLNNLYEDLTRVNRITPFRELEDTLTEIEKYVRHLEVVYDHLKNSVQESVTNAVKQEFTSLLH